jgi:hypothetical protein
MIGPGAGNGATVTAAVAQAIEATIQANGITGAWDYLIDEPTSSSYSSIISWASIIHQNAPGLKVMVTTMPQTGLPAGTVDIYAPVENQFAPGVPSPFFLYVSCMSHGACSGPTGNLTGQPDLMLDESATNELAFPLTVKVSGGTSALYYQSQYAYSTSASDPWLSQYYFDGNGDGNLFYPGIPTSQAQPSPTPVLGPNPGQSIGQSTNMAVASVRLKMLRAGSYLVDYSVLSGTPIPSTLVSSATSWSKNAADYAAFKMQAAGLSIKKPVKKAKAKSKSKPKTKVQKKATS